MKRYEEYKDSGIEWIGQVPKGWNIMKSSLLFRLIGSGTTPPKNGLNYADEGYNWLQTGDLNDGYITDTSKYITDYAIQDSSALTLFPKGSLLIAMYGATIGKLGILNIDCYTNQACCVLGKAKEIDTKFAFYTYRAGRKSLINESRGGGQPNISQDIIRHFKILIPPLPEQQSIASFLDAKTKPIDNIISKREKQIELLEEMKSAIISRAVTKGLNPNTKMKDSGIEWIGDIPEEWSMIKTSLLFGLIGSGTTPPKNGTNYADEGLCWLQTGDLNDGYISDTSKYITESAIQENSALTLFSKGSLVIAMYGATIGKIGILDIDCYTNQACCVLGKGKKINIKYAFYTYQACKSALINESRGGGQPNISQDIIRHFKIPVPPLEEQDYISSYLDTETSKLDSRIAKRRKQIELLHEYKQALITNAVTGKIDVRGFNS